MKILFIGDVVGRPGREAVKAVLPELKAETRADLIIANAENAHHGKGVTENDIKDLKAAGVDFFTSGNHIWKEKSVFPLLDDPKVPLIRPANYPEGVPGKGWQIVETASKKKVLVINLLGRLFMNVNLDCPFKAVDKILQETAKENLNAIFVDFHAEATSEKIALANFLDGRVSAMLGTHTHVATADWRILPQGTAFQSDVGFVGPLDSVIGVEKELIIRHFLTSMPTKHEIAGGPSTFNATLVDINDQNRLATKIDFIQRIVGAK